MFGVALHSGRLSWLRRDVLGPMEKAFVKSPAIKRQPAEQWVKPSSASFHAKRHTSPNPTDGHIYHVRVGIARTAEEACQPSRSPRGKPIQQREAHRRAFERKPAQLVLDLLQCRPNSFRRAAIQRRVVTLQKNRPDLL